MNTRMIVALFLAVALVPLAPSAMASHTGAYSRNPVEHDDQGRSNEPDFASTGVLGPLVENKVIDLDFDGIAATDSSFGGLGGKKLAPGCTDDSGRQPSGLCGMYTIGAGTSNGANMQIVPDSLVGVQGMSGDAAPGVFTPKKSTAVRFLDAIHHIQLQSAGSTYIEVNRKLDDSGTRAILGGADASLANDILAGPSAIWAWYGAWTDKNGNGVIDSWYNDAGFGPAAAKEEFVWYGNCNLFPSGKDPRSITAGFCALDTEAKAGRETKMVGFLFPGNHHAYCGGFADPLFLTCPEFAADAPGRQLIHFTGANDLPTCNGTTLNPFFGWFCDTDLRTFDDTDDQFFGDPILGPQGTLKVDQEFNDRTGDRRIDVRQWVFGLGWQTYFYDQSVLVSLVQVTGVGCPEDSSENTVNLRACRFADVDKFGSLNPAAETILQNQLKPAARSQWVFARTEYIPVKAGIEGVRFNRALDTSPTRGPVDDATYNPGISREPNTAADAYPGATRGSCGGDAQHKGWCNDYGAHKAGAVAYGDLLVTRALIVNRPVGQGGCVLCVAGVFLTTDFAGEAPAGSPAPVLRAAGDHRATLGPGQYIFGGVFGKWRDTSQVWEESFYDPTCAVAPSNALGSCGGTTGLVRTKVYTAAPDGWVGNIVNQTSTFYYRGYTDEACSTDQGAGIKTYGACHPYLDGMVQNPQGYGIGTPPHKEFTGLCDGVQGDSLVLRPADGTWNIPVIVWRKHFNGIDADDVQGTVVNRIQDLTGTIGDIVLSSSCATGALGGGVAVQDMLILPLGNQGETFSTIVTVNVGADEVTDVDTYHGW